MAGLPQIEHSRICLTLLILSDNICVVKTYTKGTTMSIVTISAKGQIMLPASARKAIGLNLHDRVVIAVSGDKIIVRKARDFFALKGFLGRALPPEKERAAMKKADASR